MAGLAASGQGLGTVKQTFIAMTAVISAMHVGAARAETPSSLTSQTDSATATADVQPLRGKDAYRAFFAAMRSQNWAEAKSRALGLDEDDPVRAVALSELYTARNSPRVELFDLLDLLNKASWVPDADQLGKLAQKRGAQMLPDGPQVRKLMYLGSAPRRRYLPTVKTDTAAQALVARLLPFIKNDDPAGAEALIDTATNPVQTGAFTAATPDPASSQPGTVAAPGIVSAPLQLSPDGLAEAWERVAWSYYIGNDDANARRLATRVLETGSTNDWAVQAHWTIGLAAWRQNDPRAAAPAFEQVARNASNDDMQAAGAYWAARAWMNAGQPERVEPWLKQAAGHSDSFYGMLARETLGMAPAMGQDNADNGAVRALDRRPAVKAALTLHDIGEDKIAGELLRREAEIGPASEYNALLDLAGRLSLPSAQIWLAQHGPAGEKPGRFARFPRPQWTPDGGWRVDPALVFAHALQESGFQTDIVSPAGARGLMQVLPGTAKDMAGTPVSTDQLNLPSTNMEYGQRYLEQLRDMSATGGLLPKVMAAYNAGPSPVERWNSEVKDGGDPLLFMESLPYYETRAYVNIVMRNYWMYQLRDQGSAPALVAMAQGKWPAFPTMRNGKVVQMSYYRK